MEQLNHDEENLIQKFVVALGSVETIEDMFPPDSNVREPRRPHPPTLPGHETVALAAVYDLTAARRRRSNVMQNVTSLVVSSNQLVGVGR